MKRLIIFMAFISATLVISGLSNAASIDLISQTFSISGKSWPGEIPYTPQSSSSPVTLDSYGWPGNFATGNIGDSSAVLEASVWLNVYGVISSKLTFRTLGSSFIDFLISGDRTGVDAYWSIALEDLTTGIIIYNYPNDYIPSDPNDIHEFEKKAGYAFSDFSFRIPVDPTHVYLLDDTAHGLGGDGAFAQVTMSLVPTPEPITVLLLGFGIMGLAGMKRFKH